MLQPCIMTAPFKGFAWFEHMTCRDYAAKINKYYNDKKNYPTHVRCTVTKDHDTPITITPSDDDADKFTTLQWAFVCNTRVLVYRAPGDALKVCRVDPTVLADLKHGSEIYVSLKDPNQRFPQDFYYEKRHANEKVWKWANLNRNWYPTVQDSDDAEVRWARWYKGLMALDFNATVTLRDARKTYKRLTSTP